MYYCKIKNCCCNLATINGYCRVTACVNRNKFQQFEKKSLKRKLSMKETSEMTNKYLVTFIDGTSDVYEAQSFKDLVLVERWVSSVEFINSNKEDGGCNVIR